jgi:hypothetical protein
MKGGTEAILERIKVTVEQEALNYKSRNCSVWEF